MKKCLAILVTCLLLLAFAVPAFAADGQVFYTDGEE